MTPAQADAVRILSRIEIANLNERLFIRELAEHPAGALDDRKAGYLARIAGKHGVTLAEDAPNGAGEGAPPGGEGRGGEAVVLVPVAACRPSPTAREVKIGKVIELVASIREVGLRQPINVRPLPGGLYEIRGGGHRVAAFAELGRETIPAFVRDDGDLLAELAEIDENLIRNELGPAERAAAVARRKSVYVTLHPETAHGGDRRSSRQVGDLKQDVDGRDEPGHDGAGAERFTAATARATGASERTVQREAERGEAIGEAALRRVAGTSLDKGEELDALARLPEDKRAPLIERAAAGEKVSAKTAAKKDRRETREAELGARQAALPDKRYGVIYADPEWRFEPWSRETGMDRAADNHYPTSETAVIVSRPVMEIAAPDAALFLWATAPMLPDALRVMAAWGFAYKTHLIWHKTRPGAGRGSGYWFTGEHELLLLGTRGAIPAPATAVCGSVIASPALEHSEKPEAFAALIEGIFPSLPKIELNARVRRPGWDAWGLEAPGEDETTESQSETITGQSPASRDGRTGTGEGSRRSHPAGGGCNVVMEDVTAGETAPSSPDGGRAG